MNYNSINVGDIIDNVELDGNEVHFTLPREPISGNALVAVKDVNGSVLWSWHIWIVDYDPESKKVTLNNGAVIMDRNLGAISAAPGANEAIGFMYQWGRKDPFPYPEYNFTIVPSEAIYYDYYDPSTSIESTIPTPYTVYDGAEWNYDSTLWGVNKTKYDPCPRGWKVSERGIWNGMHRADNYNSDYFELDPTCSDTYVSFPVAGRSEGTNYLYGSTCDGHMWTSTRGNYARIYIYDSYIYIYDNPVDHGYGIRCMKDADFVVKTGAAINVKGTSFDIAGNVTVNDGTTMDSVGFIYSDYMYADLITLSHDDIVNVNLGTKTGDLKTTLTGLKPNTEYRVRAYAKGGYNVRYGEELYIKTPPAGNGEGFDDGGDYEWE